MKITDSGLNFIREPLKAPFGFKGGYVDELWNSVVKLSCGEKSAVGLGVQSVLWSDADIFTRYSPSGGNAVMFLLTEYALKLAKNVEFTRPDELFRMIYPKVLEYGKLITGCEKLRPTFALNAMVPVDMAAWILYAHENNISDFDALIPRHAKKHMTAHNDHLAAIPLITYGIDKDGIKSEVESGSFFLKIKIGSDPEHDGDRKKMLEWDKKRLMEIHNVIGNIKTPYTYSGKIPYYLDANGRYDSVERLMSLLEYADEIGALENIILVEEPFSEECKFDVHKIPARIAADESAHSDSDVRERIALGYSAVALKPIAKTMSMTFDMICAAGEYEVPCFCADLTVNPFMVDINKNFAARLAPLPGMKIGVLESNGHQNYRDWEGQKKLHPMYGAEWIGAKDGLFELSAEFWNTSGGIFKPLTGYKV